MTIPTDGRIDLDALAELHAWLLKRAQPNSGLRYERYGDGLARVELYGADATFVADHFHSKGAKTLADAIDLVRRAAIPSEQGKAVPTGEDWRTWCEEWHAAVDSASLMLGLPVGLGASEFVEAVRSYTHPAPAARVKVKALEWEEVSSKILDARDGTGGLYRLRKNEDGSWTAIKYGDPFRADRETLDDARAAAQQDYEARILSALDQEEPK